ncbi:hypothetical protein M153_3100036838 [Pseudoloma neurophilia]|uniref:Uncharacterized protein n=1 Tax=Pseudoloma neurophilia TaxID=146866 RepID=A0A0R0M0X2_9MICR|nr:hypothetical protein M153_3100036838 [Pseudoloma neurophilia]
MKLNFYHKLDLSKSTVIEFHHPKPKRKRQQDDNYDFDDKLIEHMEHEDELVQIESNVENFFVYQGTMEEHSQIVLKRYEQRLKKTVKPKTIKIKDQTQQFAENFSLKMINYYNESKSYLENEIKSIATSKFRLHDDMEIVPQKEIRIAKSSYLIESLIILESFFTTKSFQDITADLVINKGPVLEQSDLEKIIARNKAGIDIKQKEIDEMIQELNERKIRDEQQNLIFSKKNLVQIAELVDKKMKDDFLHAMAGHKKRETHRILRKNMTREALHLLSTFDIDHLKKLLAKIDLIKMPKKKA